MAGSFSFSSTTRYSGGGGFNPALLLAMCGRRGGRGRKFFRGLMMGMLMNQWNNAMGFGGGSMTRTSSTSFTNGPGGTSMVQSSSTTYNNGFGGSNVTSVRSTQFGLV